MSQPAPKQMVASTATAKSVTMGLPFKLRAACNACFAAKVRCDGNKESCKRCVDKRITCIFSESRVGKVVGKRKRKQHSDADDSIGKVDSETWSLDQQQFASMPSPAATASSSESSSKRHCSEDSWTYFIADEQTMQQEYSEASEAFQSIDMVNQRSSSVDSEIQFNVPGRLQTPQLSPPTNNRYLSPAMLEARPMSRQASNVTEASLIQRTPSAASMVRSVDPVQPEDDETVCIKLLAHLKKYSANLGDQSHEFRMDLLTKGNASVRRILRSRSARNDHSCQFLLSSILTHLTTLCENLCYTSRNESAPVQQSSAVQRQRNSEAFDMRTGLVYQTDQQTSSEALRPLLLETSSLAVDLGNMLKRVPLDGFQTLGRWEMYVLDLGFRLQSALATL